MLNKIISVIMSFAISLTGMVYSSINDMIDAVSEFIFGIPCSIEAIKDDFFSDIDASDIETVDEDKGFVNDKIAVFLNPDISFSEKLSFFNSIDGTLVGWSAPADLYVLDYDEMTFENVMSECERIYENENVELAVPVTAFKYSSNKTPVDDFGYPDISGEWDELNPEGRNWWLEAIDARQAWDYEKYFSRIDIGVVDAGFDVDHNDLNGKIYFPDSKQAGRNRQNPHGCHVAGIIGANHNSSGIAGICNNSRLICVDWEPELLQLWISDLEIYFALSTLVESGAKVINFSLGTSGTKHGNSSNLWERLITPAAYSYTMSSLLAKGYDFVAVQSAGNGDADGNPIDAKYNGSFTTINKNNVFTGSNNVSADDILNRIIIVGSVDNNGDGTYTQSFFSNVGSTISVSAPGESIYSCSIDGGYEYLSGTSMSAPIVTGVASLVWSVNPSFTGADVKDIIHTSTDSVAEIYTRLPYAYDVELEEYPVVNAKLAVEEAIRRTDSSVGTVSGKITKNAAEIVCDGVSHTVFSDGTFSFVSSAGTSTAQVLDSSGNIVGSFALSISAGETVDIGEIIFEQSIPATNSDAVKE
ncbi:MAG: S8 family serine peptidase [Clostridia bacterium]|nr:S8 family serine peptidase [Clostridia bacterium]